jgi:UPF0271 protein
VRAFGALAQAVRSIGHDRRMSAPSIDLNADLGEGAGHDEALLRIVTSANVACGGHAGGGAVAATTCAQACRHGVMVGAHPGHRDREHFGRRALPVTPAELDVLLTEQLDALRSAGTPRYLKLHGALYHQVADDPLLAAATTAVAVRAGVAILGPPGSVLLAHAAAAGVQAAAEGFVDRRYRVVDGTLQLVPRGEPGAVLAAGAAVAQAVQLATDGTVTCGDGTVHCVLVDSLCVHGDSPDAVRIASRVRAALEHAGVSLRAFAA